MFALKSISISQIAIEKLIQEKDREMKDAAKHLDFELAAILRDELRELIRKTKSVRPVKDEPTTAKR